jgi:hypothetical protein
MGHPGGVGAAGGAGRIHRLVIKADLLWWFWGLVICGPH